MEPENLVSKTPFGLRTILQWTLVGLYSFVIPLRCISPVHLSLQVGGQEGRYFRVRGLCPYFCDRTCILSLPRPLLTSRVTVDGH